MNAFASIPAPFPSSCTVPLSGESQRQEEDGFSDDCTKGQAKSNNEIDMITKEDEGKSDWDAQSVSDDSDSTFCATPSELLSSAKTCKEDGSSLLKEGQVDEACKVYERGIKRLKKITVNGDVSQTDIDNVKLALYLNISLCHFRLSRWPETIQSCCDALVLDSCNVKGLFRRGVARSRNGFLKEARADLIRVCQLAPSNVEARSELKRVNEKLEDARNRDRKAFNGLFTRAGGLYKDREQQMEERRKRQAEEALLEQQEYQEECKRRQAHGESSPPSFEVWKKERAEAQKENNREPVVQTTQSKSSVNASSKVGMDDLDEEDIKIMEETKKMGYCYFNRPVNPEVKKKYVASSQPVKVTETNSNEAGKILSDGKDEKTLKCSLSSWNNKGTTYEEKDCSTWARNQLKELLSDVCVKNEPNLNVEQINEALQVLKSGLSSNEHVGSVGSTLAKVLPFTCKVQSVDTIEGDAQVVVLCSSKRYLYDMKIVLSFSVTIQDPINVDQQPTQYMGTLQLEDVSSALSSRTTSASDGSCQVEWLRDAKVLLKKQDSGVSPLHQPVWNHAVLLLKNAVYSAVQTFDGMFHDYA